jgi:thiol-disulfide isomerase/thioredoxin
VPELMLVLRLLLAGMFAVAAAAKLVDRRGAREAAAGFGVPAALTAAVAVALPLAELAVAALLVPTGTARAGAGGALVLLLAFCAAIAVAIARGRVPDCHCFGALHSAPAGPATLARNAALAAVAGAVLSAAPLSATAWLGDLTAPERAAVLVAAAALALAAGCAAIAWQLLRAHGRLLQRVERLERGADPVAVGEPAPAFTLPGLHGRDVSLRSLQAAGAPVLLVFSDPGCGPCRALMPAVAEWQRRLAGRLTVAVISAGERERVQAEAAEHGLRDVLLSPDRAVAGAYAARGTPAAALIGADGLRRGEVAAGQSAIEALVRTVTGAPVVQVVPPKPKPKPRPVPTPGPSVGEAVPAIDLPTLDGGRFELARRTGPTLLVSWNPGCGFCRKMVEPLRAALAADGIAQVVLLARGESDANRALDPPGIVALDADGAVAQALGAAGTPIGVLVDERGRVAAGPAVGADAALALLREPTPVG